MQQAVYPTAYVRALLDVATEFGISQETLLEHAGLNPDELLQPGASVEQPQLMMMYQAIQLLSGEQSVGLEVGRQVHPGLFSTLGYALKSCATLGEAMLLSQQYQPVVMGQGLVRIESKGEHVTMHWTPRSRTPALLRPLNESIMASYLHFGRSISGLNLFPDAVGFCHSRPDNLSAYQALFNCSMAFDESSNSMTVPKRILATPLKEADPQLKALMLDELKRYRFGEPVSDLSTVVEQCLVQNLGRTSTSMQSLAGQLHMSERTLRRQLAREGQTLTKIREGVVRERAEYWLRHSDKTIAEIAVLLGYRNNSCFSQAFKTWHGVSPRAFRTLV